MTSIRACCVRCNTEIAQWSASLSSVKAGDLYPSELCADFIGPEYVIIFENLEKARCFLKESQILEFTDAKDIWGNESNVNSALVCPSCGFLLASSPKNSTIVNHKKRVVLYRTSLRLFTTEMPVKSLPVSSHNELSIVNKREDFDIVLKKSAQDSSINPLTILIIGQFSCPYCVHAVDLISSFCSRQKHVKNTDSASYLLLDKFTSGGATPNALPDDVREIVCHLSVPSFLFWFRGRQVIIEKKKEHFRFKDGAILGLDFARYIDITLPHILKECISNSHLGVNSVIRIKL